MNEVFVYVIGPMVGPQKIGVAKNVKLRMDTLQVGCPFDLRVHASISHPDEISARRAEKMAHRILSASRQRGEWFNVTPSRAAEIAQIASSQGGADVDPEHSLIVMREAGALTWDEYEAAMAFCELAKIAMRSDYKDASMGARHIERTARATAIAKSLSATIRETAGDEPLRVLLHLTVKGIEPRGEELPPLRQALAVVEAKLEDATSANAA